MAKIKIKNLILISIVFVTIFFAGSALAALDENASSDYNVIVISKANNEVTVSYPVLVSQDENGFEKYNVKTAKISDSLLKSFGGVAAISVDDELNVEITNGKVTEVNLAKWKTMAGGFIMGDGGDIWKTKYVYNRLFRSYCKADQAVECWTGKVYSWSRGAILLLSTSVMIGAGIIYMTSTGDPKRIAMAKKYALGALTGVAVMVLGNFFLTKVIGVSWIS